MSGRTSEVWKYFILESPDDAKAVCTFCHAKISRGGTNARCFTTSNLKKHLDSVHSAKIKAMRLSESRLPAATQLNSAAQQSNLDASDPIPNLKYTVCGESGPSTSSSSTIPIYQPAFHKIKDMFQKQQPLSPSSSRAIHITDLIGKMICSDLLPFKTVENEGFRNLISYLEPRYRIPDRTTFSRKIIPELYQSVQCKVRECLETIEHVSITTDMWSTNACEDFMSLTTHFVDANYEHKSLCLDVIPFSLPTHTAQSIATVLNESLQLWGIHDKIHAVVTDNAANMVGAISLANLNHISCTAHTLQLVIKETFLGQKSIADACAKARRIVGHFRHSISASKLLKNYQETNKLPVHRLIQDEPTRWNSTYLMLNRLLEQRRAITWLLPELKCNTELSSTEWSLIEQAVNTLKSFYLATLNISSECVTAAEVIPTVYGIKNEITSLSEQTTGLKGIQKDIIHSLKTRFKDLENNKTFAIATLLDPRFKKTVFASPDSCNAAVTHLVSEIADYPSVSSISNSTDEVEKKRMKVSAMHSIYANIINQTSLPSTTNCLSAETEVEMYLAEPLAPVDSDPLKYWLTAPHSRLRKAARKYLSSPSGSVASERLFSAAGLVSSKKRSSLNPEKLRQLVFLNKNINIL